MKKRALLATTFLIFSLAGLTGVIAFPSYVNNYVGTGHGGCHLTNPNGAPPTVITTANFTLVLSNTSILETDSYLLLTVYVNNFTDILNADYANETTIGFSFSHTTPNDNDQFIFKPSREEAINIDSNGDSITGAEFEIITPSLPGNYILLITAISGDNASQSGSSGSLPLLTIEYELNLSIVPLNYIDLGPGGEINIPGFDLFFITFGIFITVIPISILIIRKRRKNAL